MTWTLLTDSTLVKTLASLVLLLVGLTVRASITRALLRNAPKSELRRLWIVRVRNTTFIVIVIGLTAIWFEVVESFGTAVLAVAVAFVIATKELLQCVFGAFARTVTNAYAIGDRIEVGECRGDVVDTSLLTTTLMEVGPGPSGHLRTGRTIVIPNSKLLEGVVVNESSMKEYVVHFVSVVVPRQDWEIAERLLLAAAEAECQPFIDDAREQMELLERQHGLTGLPLTPRVLLQLDSTTEVTLVVRFPSPLGSQHRIEQAILRRYLLEVVAHGGSGPHARRAGHDVDLVASE